MSTAEQEPTAAVLAGAERLLAAAASAAACGYSGLAASLEHIETVLTALPAPHARRISEALDCGAATDVPAAPTRGTRR